MESTWGAKGSSSKGPAQKSTKAKTTTKTKPRKSASDGSFPDSNPKEASSPLSSPSTPSDNSKNAPGDAESTLSPEEDNISSPDAALTATEDGPEPATAEPPSPEGQPSSTEVSSNLGEDAPLNEERPYQVLYVSDIDHVSREEHLWHAFAPWADGIRSIRLIRYVGKPYSLTHAYVNFTNHQDAKHAFENVQPLFVNSSYCRVVPYDGETLRRPERFDQNGGAGVFIKNLDVQVTALMLWGYFMDFGKILGCRVAIDEYGVPRGFAYVTYSTPEQASVAIKKMDGQLVGRRRVAVSRNLPKDQRGVRIFIKFDADAPKKNLRDSDVQEALKTFGSLEAVSVPKDTAGVAKGFALATFREPADASRVLAEVKEIAGISVFLDVATGAGYRHHTPLERSPSYSLDPLNPAMSPAINRTVNSALGVDQAPLMLSASNPSSSALSATHATRFFTNPLSNQKISSTNLFVRPLPKEIREEDLLDEFGVFGRISSAKVIVHPEGYSRGFGFVSFESPEDAKRATEELNGAERWGQQLFVAPAQSKRKPHPRLMLHHAALNRPMASSLPQFAGLYYIPMEYAYDYSPYAATAALSMAGPTSMMPPPLPTQGSLAHLESSSVEELGEWLHPYVVQHSAIGGNLDLASRITGLLLQQPKRDIVSWLESPALMELRIQQGYDAYQEWSSSQSSA